MTLLLRTGKRKIALTEEGRKVYTHAKVILQNCADLTRQLMEHAHLELTLAASSIPHVVFAAGLSGGFSRQYPQYRFTPAGRRQRCSASDGPRWGGPARLCRGRFEPAGAVLRADRPG